MSDEFSVPSRRHDPVTDPLQQPVLLKSADVIPKNAWLLVLGERLNSASTIDVWSEADIILP